ncbi:MAG TPA: ribosome small subunit-dependent GTPase A [Steroidobacteraceae bacterium]|jgi:ribosome biogenesis GTPase|nr:ribosome small subunit-dependent GTPase A [Steroidobacteraceae bacterium]
MAFPFSDLADFGWSPFFHSQLQDDELSRTLPARVMAVDRARLHLQAPDLDIHSAPFFSDDGAAATVGDWLLLDGATRRPVRLLRRLSAFRRIAAGSGHEVQYIAANIDTVFVVTSCNQDFNVARLERYLALAREAEVTPVIVLTKSDLVESAEELMHAARQVRRGVHVEAVNALDATEVARLAPWCARGQTVALLGSSGVGKSTLVGTLTGTALATQAVREGDDKGRHTTTRRQVHRLPTGGLLLDTPGMRELQLVDVAAGLADVFADIDAAAARCRFTDCQHEAEPGCAVLEALGTGDLDADRLRRWRKLVRENARNSESLADRHARDRRFGRLARQVMQDKRRRRDDP